MFLSLSNFCIVIVYKIPFSRNRMDISVLRITIICTELRRVMLSGINDENGSYFRLHLSQSICIMANVFRLFFNELNWRAEKDTVIYAHPI